MKKEEAIFYINDYIRKFPKPSRKGSVDQVQYKAYGITAAMEIRDLVKQYPGDVFDTIDIFIGRMKHYSGYNSRMTHVATIIAEDIYDCLIMRGTNNEYIKSNY